LGGWEAFLCLLIGVHWKVYRGWGLMNTKG